MPPEERLDELLGALRRDVATLRRYAHEIPWDLFVRSEDHQNMVFFALYRAAQTSIDLGQRLLVLRDLGGAETYAGVFDRLAAHGLLPEDLARRLRGWAGLRNVIAHIYRLTDLQTIHRAYAHEVEDLAEFAVAVEKAIGA
jgi:uncharacterized protein YutE (UPF0331/DUF86 family)